MFLGQIATYSLVDILGSPQAVILAGTMMCALISYGIGFVRKRVSLIGFSFCFLLLICIGNLGRIFLISGSQYYSMGMNNAAMDPSVYGMQLGHLHASVGASLLTIFLGGGLGLITYFLIKGRISAGD